jgi:LCP family protein required for cell wall assembly
MNHAHAYGGLDLMVNVVQDFLNIPIDYHVSIADEHFYQLIDAFGGVRVYNNTVAFSIRGYDFPLGYIDLTGESAYYYVRMRYQDPRGDYGRQERQRDVLQAMVNEMAGVTAVTRYQHILSAVEDVLRTNVELDEMIEISIGYNRALRNVINLDMHYSGRIINGMYLIPIPEESRLAMSQRLREHLELD